MSLREHKRQLYSELETRYQHEDATVTMADSILIREKGLITKIPMQKCTEEVYLLRTFKKLGIPTVEIVQTSPLQTQIGEVDSYTMKEILDAKDVIKNGNRFITPRYYSFLRRVFDQLQTVPMIGAGAIEYTAGDIKTQFATDAELLKNVLMRTKAQKYWPEPEMSQLEDELSRYSGSPNTIMVHTDILNNIITDGRDNFYLIDPQTIVSAANRYWDLSYYLIYANGFGCTQGLAEFIKTRDIKENWNQFMITAKVNAYERTSFYSQYGPEKVPGMLAFLVSLKEGKIKVGDRILTQNDL